MADHLVQHATAGIGRLLSTLDAIHGSVEEARALLKLLGWDLPPGLNDIGLAALDLEDFLTKLEAVLDASEAEWNDDLAMAGRIADLALAIEALTRQIHDLAQTLPARLAAFGDYVDRTQKGKIPHLARPQQIVANGIMEIRTSVVDTGVVITDDPTTPALRAGHGFSHTFHLNDLVTHGGPLNYSTGLSALDDHGFTDGDITFAMRNQDGAIVRTFNFHVTAGTTMGALRSDLNAQAAESIAGMAVTGPKPCTTLAEGRRIDSRM